MKKLSGLLLIFFTCLIAHAQVGISVAYNQLQHPEWDEFFEQPNLELRYNLQDAPLWRSAIRYGIDYRFRLGSKRIEFIPELSWTQSRTDFIDDNQVIFPVELNIYSMQFNTNFYLLDLNGDCDCPTWSKQGPTFQKGFYVQLTPGVHYFSSQFQIADVDDLSNSLEYSLGLGVGMDFGVSDWVTITPFAKAYHYFDVEWEGLMLFPKEQGLPITLDSNSRFTQVMVGLRLMVNIKK